VTRKLVKSAAFVRAARKFIKKHPLAADGIRDALEMVACDAFDPKLRTHKLKGDLGGVWACSAGYDLRILFRIGVKDGSECIVLLTIGTHDEVY
jgi:mRNA-degrading endonuclease YafQ of YafQ-DinJ toxin-antitoxin module